MPVNIAKICPPQNFTFMVLLHAHPLCIFASIVKYLYNMKLMSNTAASYQMGAGRFEPWLFVNCYRVRGVVSDWLIYRCG